LAIVNRFLDERPRGQAGDVEPGQQGDDEEPHRLRGREARAADGEQDVLLADPGHEDRP